MVRRTAPRAPPDPTLRNGGGGCSTSSPRPEAAQSTSTSSTHSCLPRPSFCLLPRHPHCQPKVPRRPRRSPRHRFLPPASTCCERLPASCLGTTETTFIVSKVLLKGVKYVQCDASLFLRASPAPSGDAPPAPPASWRQNGGGGCSTSSLCERRQRSLEHLL